MSSRKSPGLVGAQRDHEYPNTQKAGPREDRPDSTDRSPTIMPEPTDTPSPMAAAADLFELRSRPPIPTEPDEQPILLAASPTPDPRPDNGERSRALAISRVYRQRQPLSNSVIVARIIGAAIKTGRWTDDEITGALLRLADADKRLTHETLRVELTYRLTERAQQRQRGELAPESVVYVIGCDESTLVKIGTSTDLPQRLYSIQCMCPVILRVLHHHPGGYELENALHRRYRSYPRHGEWFDLGRLDPVVSVKRAIAHIEAARPAARGAA